MASMGKGLYSTDVGELAQRAEAVAKELHVRGIPIELQITRKGRDVEGNLGMELSVGLTPHALIELLEMLVVYKVGRETATADLREAEARIHPPDLPSA